MHNNKMVTNGRKNQLKILQKKVLFGNIHVTFIRKVYLIINLVNSF
jgi:hypothetical protein